MGEQKIIDEIKKDNAKAEIKLTGDLVASGVSELKPKMKSLIDEGVKELTLNLSDVEIVDSIGIGLLVAAHNSLSKEGGRLVINKASDDIKALFRSMKLEQHFSITS